MFQTTLEVAGLINYEDIQHKDIKSSYVDKSEKAVTRVVTAFQNFINPFTVSDKQSLYCISSGKPVPDNAAIDLLSIDDHGSKAYDAFVNDRLVEKSTSFHAPIKKMNLKTFASIATKKTVTGANKKSKELAAERNLFGQLILLAVAHSISLEKVLMYPLGPVPWSLATADGSPTRTDKSKLLHKLEEGHVLSENPGKALHIIDGNALFYEINQLPDSFGELATRIFNHLPNAARVDFVTDTYVTNSIKSAERERRGSSKSLLVQGPLTKVPRDFKDFLANEHNKTQLIQLLTNEWKSDKFAPKLHGRQIFVVHGERCWLLTSDDGITTISHEVQELRSSHEEADTRIILHMLHADHNEGSETIVVRSPDTDVFMLLIKYASRMKKNLIMDTGHSNKRRLIDVKSIAQELGQDLSSALLSLHAFTGCDTTSAFVRKGKLVPMRTLRSNEEYIPYFNSLGTSDKISDAQFKALEGFTCLLYGARAVTSDINKLRYTMFTMRYTPRGKLLSPESGIDLSLLPPCRTSLAMHIRRVNYQCLVWNNAHLATPTLPEPADGHGWCLVDGHIDYQWTDGDVVPVELADLLVDEGTAEMSDIDDAEDCNLENSIDSEYEESDEE